MFMDKLVAEMIDLLTLMQQTHDRLLAIATARQDAIKTFDAEGLNALLERERKELVTAQSLDQRRRNLLGRLQPLLGRGVTPTTSLIAARCNEPQKTQLLILSGQLRATIEKLDRVNRINSKVSQSVVASFAKVMSIITGVAQQAGLYMRNGRKAAISGIHLLDAVG
jgi:flagellar biosynthesis/type III secretory pathway chaperone